MRLFGMIFNHSVSGFFTHMVKREVIENAQFEVVYSKASLPNKFQKVTGQKVGSERIEVMTQA